MSDTFLCNECGQMGQSSAIVKVKVSDSPEAVNGGMTNILIKNGYWFFACPECQSGSIYFLGDANTEFAKKIKPDITKKKEVKEQEVKKIAGRPKKEQIVNDTNKDVDNIDLEVKALVELAQDNGKTIDIKNVREKLSKISNNRQDRPARRAQQLFKIECDTCEQEFTSKYEATRCRSCIKRMVPK